MDAVGEGVERLKTQHSKTVDSITRSNVDEELEDDWSSSKSLKAWRAVGVKLLPLDDFEGFVQADSRRKLQESTGVAVKPFHSKASKRCCNLHSKGAEAFDGRWSFPLEDSKG